MILRFARSSSSRISFLRAPPLISDPAGLCGCGRRSRLLDYYKWRRTTRRFESTEAAAKQLDHLYCRNDDHPQELDFPGGRVSFTSEMSFIAESTQKRVPCYRVLDDNGERITSNNFTQLNKDVAVKMYKDMVTLQTMDTIFYEAQRQGRISFYLTSSGEEAITIASAAALQSDDVVLAQNAAPSSCRSGLFS